jgi:ApaG protein
VSGCPLETASGAMAGEFHMVDEQGAAFDIKIPAFEL